MQLMLVSEYLVLANENEHQQGGEKITTKTVHPKYGLGVILEANTADVCLRKPTSLLWVFDR